MSVKKTRKERRRMVQSNKIGTKPKNKPADFTLCITVLLLLALRHSNGAFSLITISTSRRPETAIAMYQNKRYQQ